MKYLKYFEEASAYEAYKNGSDYVLPNVSFIEDVAVVMFNPNAKPTNLIEFTIDSVPYQAEEGMTWLDFVNSEYSNDDFYTDTNEGNFIVKYQGNRFKSSTKEWQCSDSVIIANEAYRTIQEE